jgi:competence protein ComEA
MKSVKGIGVVSLCLLAALAVAAPSKTANKAKAKPAQQTKVLKQVNINKADAVTIATTVKGFGPKRAEAIVKYRKEKGNFKTVDDLQKVRGIGAKFMERNRDYLKKVIKFS